MAMSRTVKINPADKIIRIFGEKAGDVPMNVHRHLLYDRSYTQVYYRNGPPWDSELRRMVKQADTKPEPDHLTITLPKLDERALLEFYVGSLYGHSMIWDDLDERDLEDEFRSLVRIHECCDLVGDGHGLDESADAVRYLIRHEGDELESPIGIILDECGDDDNELVNMAVAFTMYGNCRRASEWIYAYEPMPDLEHDYPRFIRLLCEAFMEKTTAEREGRAEDVLNVARPGRVLQIS